MATYLGLVTGVFAFAYAFYMVVRTLLYGNPVPGYASLIVAILFLGGVQLLALGIIGEYLGRTFNEAKGRPLYLVNNYEPAAGSSDLDNRAERRNISHSADAQGTGT